MALRTELKWRHYQGRLSKAELLIELNSLAEFMRFAEDHRIQTIYCLGSTGQVQQFGMSHKGGLLVAKADGYDELTDYKIASTKGFADAATYYDAVSKGFDTLEAYQLSVGSELNDPETYQALVAGHYEDGFQDYTRMVEEGHLQTQLDNISNPYDLYKYGTDAGFANWFDLQVGLEKGFTKAADYRSATELGYTSATDFMAGTAGGFISAKEWDEAQQFGCTTRLEFRGMKDLEAMDASGLKHDARVLLQLFSRMPEKKEITVDKMQQLLEKKLTLYQDPKSKMFRSWFTFELRDRSVLLEFLRKNQDIKCFGSYRHDREVFITRAVEERHVVLDGSNVAHNSRGNHYSVPKVENLQRMIDELTKRGFKDIKVIVDASLKHKIDDRDALEAFAETIDYFESPPNTSADIFVINHVKRHNCLLISNDLFREWKAIDPWIGDNIDYYRLTFNITDKKVILPEFDG